MFCGVQPVIFLLLFLAARFQASSQAFGFKSDGMFPPSGTHRHESFSFCATERNGVALTHKMKEK